MGRRQHKQDGYRPLRKGYQPNTNNNKGNTSQQKPLIITPPEGSTAAVTPDPQKK